MNVFPSGSALRRAVSVVRPARSAVTAASIVLGLLVASSAHAEFTTPVASYGVNGVATFSAGDGFVLPITQRGGLVPSAVSDSGGRLYVLYRAMPPAPSDGSSHLYLVRLDSTGTLDGSFPKLDLSLAGVLSGDLGGDIALALDESRSRLYFVTLPLPADERAFSFTVSALTLEGIADTTFGTNGKLLVSTDLTGPSFDKRPGFSAAVDQTTGRLVLAGAFAYSPGDPGAIRPPLLSNRVTIIYAIKRDGTLDMMFDGDGMKLQSLASEPELLSSASFGVAVGPDGRILSLGAGLRAGPRYVGTVFSDLSTGATDPSFNSNGSGLRVLDLIPTETAPEGESTLTQLLFSRVLSGGESQYVGLTGRVDQTTFDYQTNSLSLIGIQLTRNGEFDPAFSDDGMETASIDLFRSPPTALFADGRIAAVFRASSLAEETRISVRVIEGFRVPAVDGGSTTGGTTGGSSTGGGTTGGTTTGGATTGDTTTGGSTTGGTTTGGTTTGSSTTGGSTTGGTTTGGTTTGDTTTGGSTTGGSTTGGTTPGGDSSSAGGGGGSVGLFGVMGLMIGALLRRRRGFGAVHGA